LRVGAFAGAGAGAVDPITGLASEYGPIPFLGYAALSVFF
jgi:hypothetical protein